MNVAVDEGDGSFIEIVLHLFGVGCLAFICCGMLVMEIKGQLEISSLPSTMLVPEIYQAYGF